MLKSSCLLAAALLLGFVAQVEPVGATGATPGARSVADRPGPAGPPQVAIRPTDQLPGAPGPAQPRVATAAPFLTRPYWGPHSVNSVFDHCNPTYTFDGQICETDGTVDLRAYGVSPYYPGGYAPAPGSSDYRYYDGHNGWDLGLNYENLMAAADGVVNLAGWDPQGFGYSVIIDHPNGLSTRYAHMSQIWVTHGQAVRRGQWIGVSGNSGNSSGPHLHFGVYLTASWTAIDPWGWTGAPGADPWPADVGNLWLTGNPHDPVPSAPVSVTARPGDSSAAVSWSPPAFDGGAGIQSYRVVASPGGATATVPGTLTSTIVPGLSNGAAYTFTVVAGDGIGEGPASAPSAAVTPEPNWPGQYHPLAPRRLLDTRQSAPPLGGGATLDVTVAGVGGVPLTGAAAVLVNLTATNPSLPGYLSAYASGGAPPTTSNLNFDAGQTVANPSQVTIGSNGRITIANFQGSVDVVVDLEGWTANAPTTSGGLGRLQPLAPARLLDTRSGVGGISGRQGMGSTVALQVAGRGGIPPTGVAAAVLNLTTTNTAGSGYVTAYPGGTVPAASSHNFDPGLTQATRLVAPLDAQGRVWLYTFGAPADLVVDGGGWYTDPTGPAAGGLDTGLPPSRILDTRQAGGPVGSGPTAVATLSLAGHGGIPAMASTTPPQAVLLRVTVTDTSAPSYLTVFPGRTPPPLASDLNWQPGQTVSNLVAVKIGSDGTISMLNFAGSADLVVDLVAWFG